MKKIVLSLVTLVGMTMGEQWQLDSAPFSFPGTAVAFHSTNQADALQFSFNPVITNGAVTISYHLPAAMTGATISIYSLNGALINRFSVSAAKSAFQWDVSTKSFVHGVYLATLQCGSLKKTLTIALVR